VATVEGQHRQHVHEPDHDVEGDQDLEQVEHTAWTAWVATRAAPTIDMTRPELCGFAAALWAAFELVTWDASELSPCGEKTCPSPPPWPP